MYLTDNTAYVNQKAYHLHMPTVLKSGSLNLLEPSGPVQACNGIALHLPLQKRTWHLQYLLFLQCKSGCTNVHHCYFYTILPDLFSISLVTVVTYVAELRIALKAME